MKNASNLINDGLTTNCQNGGNPTYSYNQGVILGALVDLHKNGLTFANKAPLTVAQQIANAVIVPGSPLSKNDILVEPAGQASGDVGSDLPQFKGIFMRNLATLATSVDQAPAARYVAFIRNNVRSILAGPAAIARCHRRLARHAGAEVHSLRVARGGLWVSQRGKADIVNPRLRRARIGRERQDAD